MELLSRLRSGRARRLLPLAGALLLAALAIPSSDLVLAQAPPPETEIALVNGDEEVVERKEDGRFIARPVFDQELDVLYYGVRHPDTGDWLTSMYRVQGGAKRLADGKRVVRTRFGVDDDVCTGDRACIRLSGCPSITIKPNPDPLRTDPVAHVNNDCVGCGVCGEVAHAAVLCPSFYRAEIVANPRWLDRKLHGVRRRVIRRMQGAPTEELTA